MSSWDWSRTKTGPWKCLPLLLVLQQIWWQKNFVDVKNIPICPKFPKTKPKKESGNSSQGNKSRKWGARPKKFGYCFCRSKIHHSNWTFYLWWCHHQPPSTPSHIVFSTTSIPSSPRHHFHFSFLLDTISFSLPSISQCHFHFSSPLYLQTVFVLPFGWATICSLPSGLKLPLLSGCGCCWSPFLWWFWFSCGCWSWCWASGTVGRLRWGGPKGPSQCGGEADLQQQHQCLAPINGGLKVALSFLPK